jgi:hypothetical protein
MDRGKPIQFGHPWIRQLFLATRRHPSGGVLTGEFRIFSDLRDAYARGHAEFRHRIRAYGCAQTCAWTSKNAIELPMMSCTV